MLDKKLKLLIFDMDGLMVDSESKAILSFLEILDDWGLEGNKEFLISLLGSTKEYMIPKLCEQYGDAFDPIAFFSLFGEKKLEHIFATPPSVLRKKGLIELLSFAKENGLVIAVASSTYRKDVINILKHAEVYEYFQYFICGDEIKNSKPNPEIFLNALQVSGFQADEAIVLEDSANGIIAAHKAGIRCIFIKDLVSPEKKVLDYVWTQLDDLGCVPTIL